MRNALLSSAVLLCLGACASTQLSTADGLIADLKKIDLTLPASTGTDIAALALTGLESVVGSYEGSVTTGASAEVTGLSGLEAALNQVITNTSGKVQADAQAALAVAQTLSVTSSSTVQAQAEAAIGTALLEYMELQATSSSRYGAPASSVAGLIADANGKIASLHGAA